MKLGDILSFEGDRNVTVLMIALVLGIYAKVTGDIQPFAAFVLIVTLIFIFFAFNFVMGKLKQ